MGERRKTIADLILEYFREHPKEDLEHGPVVDYVEEQYLKLYGKKPRRSMETNTQILSRRYFDTSQKRSL